jgi:hypothetical protein|tara:strand:+ start:837 stop:2414 length:1578 start_codon:yes stop_codon:yes gene_type:complete
MVRDKRDITQRKKSFKRKEKPVNRLKQNAVANGNGNGIFDRLTEDTKTQLLINFQQQISRREIANRLGLSFKNDARDTYKALGYPVELTFDHYWAFYTREHIAKRVVDAPVNSCWQKPPTISEIDSDDGEDTKFEKAWSTMVNERKMWHYLTRIDKLSGIGQYGVLLLGFDGGGELKTEVTTATKLLYVRPYKQNNITIKKFEDNINDERYGLPKLYHLVVTNADGGTTETIVHWSRIIHVADELIEDDIFGTPRMMNVYNLIAGLHLVAGGSGEMFWRGAFPGLAFILDKDAELDPNQSKALLETEINDYIHDMNRTMRLQGMEVQNLAPQVADPSKHVETLLSLISGAREIPKRILTGAERGELGGDRDESAWNKKVRERQTNFCTPMIVRAVIDRLIKFKVLPTPTKGYEVEWPDITSPNKEEDAKVAETLAKAVAVYGNALGAQEVVPPEVFLSEIMGFDTDVIKKITGILETMQASDLEDESKIDEQRKEIEAELIKEGKNEIAKRKAVGDIAASTQGDR